MNILFTYVSSLNVWKQSLASGQVSQSVRSHPKIKNINIMIGTAEDVDKSVKHLSHEYRRVVHTSFAGNYLKITYKRSRQLGHARINVSQLKDPSNPRQAKAKHHSLK